MIIFFQPLTVAGTEIYHLGMEDYKNIWPIIWRALASIKADWQGEYPFDDDTINPFSGKPGRHRFDWALPQEMIAVEIDGGIWLARGGRHGADVDRQKLAIAASLGWLVFRFSLQMLENYPQACVGLVEQSMTRKGGRMANKLQFFLVRDGARSVMIIATRTGWFVDRVEAPTLEEAEQLARQRIKEIEEAISKKEEEQ